MEQAAAKDPGDPRAPVLSETEPPLPAGCQPCAEYDTTSPDNDNPKRAQKKS